jgi:hypothetical protein
MGTTARTGKEGAGSAFAGLIWLDFRVQPAFLAGCDTNRPAESCGHCTPASSAGFAGWPIAVHPGHQEHAVAGHRCAGHLKRGWHTDQPSRLLGAGPIVRMSIIDGLESAEQITEVRFSNPFAGDTRLSRSVPDGSESPRIRQQAFVMALDPDDHGTSKCRRAANRPSRKRPRAPQPPPPPPHPLISFAGPNPTPRDHLIHILLETKSKRWGIYESLPAVTDSDDGGDVPDVPADLEYPFHDLTEAVNAALNTRAKTGFQFRIVNDPDSDRWGFYEVPRRVHPSDEKIVVDKVLCLFNTVAEATIGALNRAAGEPVVIHGGVVVPNMPENARIIGSPGYRAGIDGSLYDLNPAELQAVYRQTDRKGRNHARQAAIHCDIPLGQQVHAFMELWEKQPRRSRPKLHDFLDEMMPGMNKRTRQRHFKVFAIVSSDDWPDIVTTAQEEITGMASILRVARAFSTPLPRKKKTPLKERYLALRRAVLSGEYAEALRLIEQFDDEDAFAT